jgi:hypothetical protein
MKNKLDDLNNHLFEQLERMNDDELTGDRLAEEMSRSKAMTSISAQIISNAALVLAAKRAVDGGEIEKMPLLLGGGDGA